MEHFRLSKGTKEIISLSFSAKYEVNAKIPSVLSLFSPSLPLALLALSLLARSL